MKFTHTLRVSMYSFVASSLLLSAAVAEEKRLDNVTVTANKIEENIQEVPQSITVIDDAILKEKGITDVEGIIQQIPNMMAVPDHGMMVNIRGLNSSMFTNNNPVVIYIDGVPTTDRMGYDISMANVERVEVLRGPQGTLYGKDAIGGVINIITKEPTQQHEGSFGLEYSSWNTIKSDFNINGPLSEKIFYGLNIQSDTSDGWVTNELKNDDKANKTSDQKYTGFLLFKPTDNLSAKLMVSHYNESKDWGKAKSLVGSSPISAFKRSDAKNNEIDMPTFEDTVKNSQSLNVTYDFNNDMQLTSVTTHQTLDLDSEFDFDFGNRASSAGHTQFNYTENEEYTQEIRLSKVSDKLKWVVGLYGDMAEREQGPYGMKTTMVANAVSKSDSQTQAIFGQATYSITPKIDLTAGGRYQKLKRDIDLNTYMYPAGTSPSAPMYSMEGEKTWNTFLPKVALTYKHNEAMTPYVSYSEGYMPGGFNYFAMAGTLDDNSFKPQTSKNYEVGIKGIIDNFTYNIALFRMDIKDIHVFKQSGGMWLTDNADEAHSQGIEVDFTYFPTDEWEISGAAGYIDAKYDSYDAGAANYDGQRIENTPEYSFRLGVAYYHPRGFYGRIDAEHLGSREFFNSGNRKFEEVGSHTVADLKVGYKFSDFDVYAFVKNITDEEYITSYKNDGNNGIATFNDPRAFGVGLRYKF